MKTTGKFLLILIMIFLAGCGIIGGTSDNKGPRPTNTPIRWYQPVTTFTPIPSVTAPAQIAVSGNTEPATLSVSIATNCRRGPSADYDILLAFLPNQTAAIIGKYVPNNYWVIQTTNGYTCWLWGQNAMVTGNLAQVPDYPVPPLPAPTNTSIPIRESSGVSNPTPTPKPTLTPPPNNPPAPETKPTQKPPKIKPTEQPPKPKPFKQKGKSSGGNGGFILVAIMA